MSRPSCAAGLCFPPARGKGWMCYVLESGQSPSVLVSFDSFPFFINMLCIPCTIRAAATRRRLSVGGVKALGLHSEARNSMHWGLCALEHTSA